MKCIYVEYKHQQWRTKLNWLNWHCAAYFYRIDASSVYPPLQIIFRLQPKRNAYDCCRGCVQRFKQLTADECVVEYNTKRTRENQLNVLPLILPIHMPNERCTHTRTTICHMCARSPNVLSVWGPVFRNTPLYKGSTSTFDHQHLYQNVIADDGQWPETMNKKKIALNCMWYDFINQHRLLWINLYGY